jgi:hypothetical protein
VSGLDRQLATDLAHQDVMVSTLALPSAMKDDIVEREGQTRNQCSGPTALEPCSEAT